MGNSINVKQIILLKKYKNQGIGIMLSLLFGGIGVIYSSVIWGTILTTIDILMSAGIWRTILYTNDAGVPYYSGIFPPYHIDIFIYMLFINRILSVIASSISITEHNKEIDRKINKING